MYLFPTSIMVTTVTVTENQFPFNIFKDRLEVFISKNIFIKTFYNFLQLFGLNFNINFLINNNST